MALFLSFTCINKSPEETKAISRVLYLHCSTAFDKLREKTTMAVFNCDDKSTARLFHAVLNVFNWGFLRHTGRMYLCIANCTCQFISLSMESWWFFREGLLITNKCILRDTA